MRQTLHLVAGDEYPSYAQLPGRRACARGARATRTSTRRGSWASSARGCASRGPTTTSASGWGATRASPTTRWSPVLFARTLLPLVQLPPAGFWRERGRPRFVSRPPPAARSRRRGRAGGPPLPGRLRPGEPPRPRGLGRRPAARLRPRAGAPGGRRASRRARRRSCSTSPASRCRRPRRGCRCGCSPAGIRRCWPTPTASASSPPSSGPQADAERRPDRDRRRPRRRELVLRRARGRRGGRRRAACRPAPPRPAADPRGGAADGAVLRAGGAPGGRHGRMTPLRAVACRLRSSSRPDPPLGRSSGGREPRESRHAHRWTRLPRRRPGQGRRARRRARRTVDPDLQPEPAGLEADDLQRRAGRRLPRGDGAARTSTRCSSTPSTCSTRPRRTRTSARRRWPR